MIPHMLADPSLSHIGRGSYANPHATIAIRDIPTNIKQVMRLCRFYYMQDALLGAIIDKMSEYPITRIVIAADDQLSDRQRDKWDYLINVALNLPAVMRQINIDKYVYGNSFYYLSYPFVRYCTCPACSHAAPIGAYRDVRVEPRMDNGTFGLTASSVCLQCKTQQTFKITDRRSESRRGLTFVRLNPLRMRLEYNPTNGTKVWYWDPPQSVRQGLIDNVRAITDTTEMRILEAAHLGKELRTNPDRLWVSQAEGLPGIWEGWGIPPVFRVLEDVYYYKILRRANEALAQEHVAPLRILSPGTAGDASPHRSMNLSEWQQMVRRDLQRWKRDPNHIMLSPIPLNVEQVGGTARVMMVASEMEAAARVIAAGIGCPIEMIWGGLNWSGASVSLRVLENHFLNDRENCERLLAFVIPKIGTYFRLSKVETSLAEFKMGDDVQHQSNMINLMLQGFLDRGSVLPELGKDPNQVFDSLAKEHERLNQITMADNVAAAHMNTVIQALEAKAQLLLQFELQLVQQGIQVQAERQRLSDLASHVAKLHEQGLATPQELDQSAQILQRLPPAFQQSILQSWSATMPTIVALLTNKMGLDQQTMMLQQQAVGGTQGAQQAGAAAGESMQPGAEGPYADGQGAGGDELAADPFSDDEPMPEQRPPRRASSPM